MLLIILLFTDILIMNNYKFKKGKVITMKIYKRIVSLVMVCLMLLGMAAICQTSAATYIIDQGFKFTKSTSNQITIFGYEGTDTEIAIPEKLIGYPVVAIGANAFTNETTITSITIPDTIKSIGQSAFYGCTALKSITIPESVTSIGVHAFYGCTALKSINLPSTIKTIPTQFANKCSSLTEITIPDSVTTIGNYAFANCASLENVYIPESVTTIGSTAFYESEHVVICGYLNSYAHVFAQVNHVAFYAVDQVETFTVRFFDSEGYVYWMTDVKKGDTAATPVTPPEKAATDTHYYAFKSWDKDYTNVQSDLNLYPVYEKIEIPVEKPDVYYVVFLDGDGKFMSAQTVVKGEAATAPDEVPGKQSQNGKYYIFKGWDTDFSDIQSDTVVSPLFYEYTKRYTVTFVDADDHFINSYIVTHGEASPVPDYIPTKASDDEYSYTFKGWDKDLSCITDETVVHPLFESTPIPKDEPEVPDEPADPDTPPTPTSTSLKVEVSAGKGFTISINNAPARVQGPSYYNSSIASGSKVTLKANAYSNDNEFIGWIDTATGKVLSTDETYSFISSGNDFYKAMYKADLDGAQLVIFYHDKAKQQLDVQYYSAFDEIIFPADAVAAGWEFAGWSMTSAEIIKEIAAGRDVIVTPVWKKILSYVSLNVIGGTAEGTTNSEGKFLVNILAVVTADAAPEGMKFAYWKDDNGTIRGYEETLRIYPATDTTLTAVYVPVDTEIEYKALTSLDSFSEAGSFGNITISWYVPAEQNNWTFAGAGHIAVDKTAYNKDTFYHGTSDTNVFDRNADSNQPSGTYVWTGPFYVGHTVYVKTWVQYFTEAGELVIIYSDLYAITRE